METPHWPQLHVLIMLHSGAPKHQSIPWRPQAPQFHCCASLGSWSLQDGNPMVCIRLALDHYTLYTPQAPSPATAPGIHQPHSASLVLLSPLGPDLIPSPPHSPLPPSLSGRGWSPGSTGEDGPKWKKKHDESTGDPGSPRDHRQEDDGRRDLCLDHQGMWARGSGREWGCLQLTLAGPLKMAMH